MSRTIVITTAPPGTPAVALENRVPIDVGAAVLGMTKRAVEGKIYRGDWVEGRQYHRDPQGLIWIDRKGVQSWVVGEKP